MALCRARGKDPVVTTATAVEPTDPATDREPDPVDRWLTLTDAAAYACVSRQKLHRLIAAGKLPAYRFDDGRNGTRVRMSDVDALMRPIDVSSGSTLHPDDFDGGNATTRRHAGGRFRSGKPRTDDDSAAT